MEPDLVQLSFAERFATLRERFGPLVLGLDPSASLLKSWGLSDDAAGLERFVDICLEAAAGSVAVVKPQSAFFERHAWRGIKALARLVEEARSAGLLVLLDAKRGDIATTSAAYGEAYFSDGAGIRADALTVAPYLGLVALRSIFERAAAVGGSVFVVTRSSNPEGRFIQEALLSDAESVEQHLVTGIAAENARLAPGTQAPDASPPRAEPVGPVGPVGAVYAATTTRTALPLDLRRVNGLFLVPGLGVQGSTPFDVASCFPTCPERVLASASRSLLSAGPGVAALRGAIAKLTAGLRTALG